MSKRINVNPDHYKVAGRERQGKGVPRGAGISNRQSPAREERGRQRHPPAAGPVGRADDALSRRRGGQTSTKTGVRSSARRNSVRSRTR